MWNPDLDVGTPPRRPFPHRECRGDERCLIIPERRLHSRNGLLEQIAGLRRRSGRANPERADPREPNGRPWDRDRLSSGRPQKLELGCFRNWPGDKGLHEDLFPARETDALRNSGQHRLDGGLVLRELRLHDLDVNHLTVESHAGVRRALPVSDARLDLRRIPSRLQGGSDGQFCERAGPEALSGNPLDELPGTREVRDRVEPMANGNDPADVDRSPAGPGYLLGPPRAEQSTSRSHPIHDDLRRKRGLATARQPFSANFVPRLHVLTVC